MRLYAFGNTRDHGLRHFVLNSEYIIKAPVISLGPKMRCGYCID